MTIRTFAPLLLALTVFCSAGCRAAHQSVDDGLVGFDATRWQLLGERRVSLAADRDVIPVTILEGRFRRIMVTVHDSAIEMWDIRVHFANGETFSPATRLDFAEDSRSRVIDLPGMRRTIRKVEFRYRSRHLLTGAAEVELWGRE